MPFMIEPIKLAEVSPLVLRSARNELEPGFSSGVRVIQHYQLQYILSGNGFMEIAHQKYEVSKGMLCFWGPGVKHVILSSRKQPLVILGVQFHLTRTKKPVVFEDFEGFPPRFSVHSPASVENMLFEIIQEFTSQRLYWEETASALCKALLLLVARQIRINDRFPSTSWKVTEEILSYIHDSYHLPLNNQTIAAHFHFHPAYVNRLVSQATGLSLHQYVINVRINRAVELLHSTSMNIGEIAAAVGYQNIHYFSRLFKRKMGIPPSKHK